MQHQLGLNQRCAGRLAVLPPRRTCRQGGRRSGALRLLAQLRVDVRVAPRGEARALHIRCSTGTVGEAGEAGLSMEQRSRRGAAT